MLVGLAIVLATVGVAAQQFDLGDWDATFF